MVATFDNLKSPDSLSRNLVCPANLFAWTDTGDVSAPFFKESEPKSFFYGYSGSVKNWIKLCRMS